MLPLEYNRRETEISGCSVRYEMLDILKISQKGFL